jgi:hypothetical protein
MENLNGTYKIKGKQKEAGGYGASLKEDYRYFFGSHVGWLVVVKQLRSRVIFARSIQMLWINMVFLFCVSM